MRAIIQRVTHASVTVNGGEPRKIGPGLVILLNKPLGMTCSHKEDGALVYDVLPDRWRRRDPAVSTIGRLDKQTTGDGIVAALQLLVLVAVAWVQA